MSSHTNPQQAANRAILRNRLARVVSLAALLGGLLVFLVFLYQSGFFDLFRPAQKAIENIAPTSDLISGKGMVISGFDKDGRTFTITSVTAIQDNTLKDVVHLTSAIGEFERSDGQLKLSSNSAVYNTASKILGLEGQVVFEQQGRYKARMDKATMNVDTMNLSSESAVNVVMNTGTVAADHLEISDGGKKTLFTGHVKANLQSDIKSEIVP